MKDAEILKGISKIIVDSPSKERLIALANGNPIEDQGSVHLAEVNDTNKYITFTKEFMKDDTLMRKKREILDYAHSYGYKTNLD